MTEFGIVGGLGCQNGVNTVKNDGNKMHTYVATKEMPNDEVSFSGKKKEKSFWKKLGKVILAAGGIVFALKFGKKLVKKQISKVGEKLNAALKNIRKSKKASPIDLSTSKFKVKDVNPNTLPDFLLEALGFDVKSKKAAIKAGLQRQGMLERGAAPFHSAKESMEVFIKNGKV